MSSMNGVEKEFYLIGISMFLKRCMKVMHLFDEPQGFV